jgi:hypothetical protein
MAAMTNEAHLMIIIDDAPFFYRWERILKIIPTKFHNPTKEQPLCAAEAH